jgi:hypothetical protein
LKIIDLIPMIEICVEEMGGANPMIWDLRSQILSALLTIRVKLFAHGIFD